MATVYDARIVWQPPDMAEAPTEGARTFWLEHVQRMRLPNAEAIADLAVQVQHKLFRIPIYDVREVDDLVLLVNAPADRVIYAYDRESRRLLKPPEIYGRLRDSVVAGELDVLAGDDDLPFAEGAETATNPILAARELEELEETSLDVNTPAADQDTDEGPNQMPVRGFWAEMRQGAGTEPSLSPFSKFAQEELRAATHHLPRLVQHDFLRRQSGVEPLPEAKLLVELVKDAIRSLGDAEVVFGAPMGGVIRLTAPAPVELRKGPDGKERPDEIWACKIVNTTKEKDEKYPRHRSCIPFVIRPEEAKRFGLNAAKHDLQLTKHPDLLPPVGPGRRIKRGDELPAVRASDVDPMEFSRFLLEQTAPHEAFIRRRFMAAHRAFLERLDPVSVNALRRSGSGSISLYNWLSEPGGERKVRRSQALTAFPILAAMASKAVSNSIDKDRFWEVTRSIDRGERLVDILADTLKTSRPAIRSVAGLGMRHTGGAKNLGKLLDGVAEAAGIAPDLLPGRSRLPNAPARSRQWANFMEIDGQISAVSILRHQDFWKGGTTPPWLQKLSREDLKVWETRIRHVGDALGRIERDLIRAPIAYLGLDGSKVGEVDTWWLESQIRDIFPNDRARKLLVGDRGFGGLEEVAAEWQRLTNAILEAKSINRAHLQTYVWPALSRDFTCGDVRITSLTDGEALREEGEALKHCVGSYVSRCHLHGSHILALRGPNNEHLSTAEVVLKNGYNGCAVLDVIQHYGRRNTTPTNAACDALEAYITAAAAGDLEIDAGGLRDALHQRQEEGRRSSLIRHIGFERDRLEAVHEVHCFAIASPKLRGLSYEEWLDASGIRQAADELRGVLLEREERMAEQRRFGGGLFAQIRARRQAEQIEMGRDGEVEAPDDALDDREQLAP